MVLFKFLSEQVLLRTTSCYSFSYCLDGYLSLSPILYLQAGLSTQTIFSTTFQIIFSMGFSMIFSTVMGTLISLILSTKIGSCFLAAVSLSCLIVSISRGSSSSVPSLSSSKLTISLIFFSRFLYPFETDSSNYLPSVSLEELVLMVLLSVHNGSKLLLLWRVMQDLSISISCCREEMTSCCLAMTFWKLMAQGEAEGLLESCRISEFRLILVDFIMEVIIEIVTSEQLISLFTQQSRVPLVSSVQNIIVYWL